MNSDESSSLFKKNDMDPEFASLAVKLARDRKLISDVDENGRYQVNTVLTTRDSGIGFESWVTRQDTVHSDTSLLANSETLMRPIKRSKKTGHVGSNVSHIARSATRAHIERRRRLHEKLVERQIAKQLTNIGDDAAAVGFTNVEHSLTDSVSDSSLNRLRAGKPQKSFHLHVMAIVCVTIAVVFLASLLPQSWNTNEIPVATSNVAGIVPVTAKAAIVEPQTVTTSPDNPIVDKTNAGDGFAESVLKSEESIVPAGALPMVSPVDNNTTASTPAIVEPAPQTAAAVIDATEPTVLEKSEVRVGVSTRVENELGAAAANFFDKSEIAPKEIELDVALANPRSPEINVTKISPNKSAAIELGEVNSAETGDAKIPADEITSLFETNDMDDKVKILLLDEPTLDKPSASESLTASDTQNDEIVTQNHAADEIIKKTSSNVENELLEILSQ